MNESVIGHQGRVEGWLRGVAEVANTILGPSPYSSTSRGTATVHSPWLYAALSMGLIGLAGVIVVLLRLFRVYFQIALLPAEVEELLVRVVRRSGFRSDDLESVEAEMKLRLGNAIKIDYKFVDAIPREPNGEFRFVISRVPLAIGGTVFAQPTREVFLPNSDATGRIGTRLP